ncbi:MAG: hypothetical protein R3C68_19030 [Myxococcota bacterium]
MKLRHHIDEFRTRIHRRLSQIRQTVQPRSEHVTSMSAWLRPTLKFDHTPVSLRRILEPIIAVVAIALLTDLLMIGAVSAAFLMAAMGLIYLILAYVFGLDISLMVPRGA